MEKPNYIDHMSAVEYTYGFDEVANAYHSGGPDHARTYANDLIEAWHRRHPDGATKAQLGWLRGVEAGLVLCSKGPAFTGYVSQLDQSRED